MDEHKRPESFQTMVKTALKNYTVSVKTGMAPNYGSSHVYGTSQDFRLGVVGHRHDRLKNADLDELRIVIKSILIEIKKWSAVILLTERWFISTQPFCFNGGFTPG